MPPVQNHDDGSRPRQACDNCRFRKVKCDRHKPCRGCEAGKLRCEYLHALRRRGPPSGQGRRQWQIKRGLPRKESALDDFRGFDPAIGTTIHISNNTAVNVVQASSRSVASLSSSDEGYSPGQASSDGWSWSPQVTSLVGECSDGVATVETAAAAAAAAPEAGEIGGGRLDVDNYSRRLAQSLAAHVHVFLRHLFPIMPVVDDDFITDALRIDDLPPSRYAVIMALCAATRIQLRMDDGRNSSSNDQDGQHSSSFTADIPPDPPLTGSMLMGLAETALRHYSVIDDETLDSVLASFFLFASYGNLDNARHAWFYLNQSISLAQGLDMTTEAGYRVSDGSSSSGGRDSEEAENERRRRVFWLLFVTERTFAMQHRRGVQLRSSIAKPRVIDSDCPVVMHDFVNHIRVFEQLPCSLYVWQSSSSSSSLSSGDASHQLGLTHTIHDNLCNAVQPDRSVIESQRLDTLLTQQWLRIAMWRLAFGSRPSSVALASSSARGTLLPANLPIDAGRLIMSALSTAGACSKDCHGIGLEQKLFDVGVGIADSARMPWWRRSGSTLEFGPRDLLAAIVGALSKARGCPSHLLPNLLSHSDHVFGPPEPCPPISAGGGHVPWGALSSHEQRQQQQQQGSVIEDVTVAENCAIQWASEDGIELSSTEATILDTIYEASSHHLGSEFGQVSF